MHTSTQPSNRDLWSGFINVSYRYIIIVVYNKVYAFNRNARLSLSVILIAKCVYAYCPYTVRDLKEFNLSCRTYILLYHRYTCIFQRLNIITLYYNIHNMISYFRHLKQDVYNFIVIFPFRNFRSYTKILKFCIAFILLLL